MEVKPDTTYTNQDYYDYILKIDQINTPLHNTYQSILKILTKEGLNQPVSEDASKFFFNLFDVRRYDLHEKEIPELNQLLQFDSAYRRLIKNEDGSYSVYPTLIELPNEKDLLQYYSLGLKMDVNEIINYLTPIVEQQKETFKKAEIRTYYGSPKYLLLRTKAICDAMTMLNDREDVEEKGLVKEALSSTYSLLSSMLDSVGLEESEETYKKLDDFSFEISLHKEQYDQLRDSYIKVLEQENRLMDVSNKIWQNYSATNNGVLIHQLTQGMVESDRMDKICTSFYSTNANVITNYSNANTGYAYPMDMNNVLEVCEDDVGSWRVTKEEFIERAVPDRWQLDGTNIWYENPYQSKLFPPEYIEQQVINSNRFAEIIIDNRSKKVRPLYCFYTADATEKQIDEINSLATRQGLEVKSLEIKNTKYK